MFNLISKNFELFENGQLNFILRDKEGEFEDYANLGHIEHASYDVPSGLEEEYATLLDLWLDSINC